MSKESIRTPLGKVRGLGSAKHGTKNVLLVLNTFICVVLFAAAAYAVLKIAIS